VLVSRGSSSWIELYDARTGRRVASLQVPRSAQELDVATSGAIVFRVKSEIRVLTRQGSHVVARSKAPIGLSIEGRRIAWAENLGAHSRIRAVELR
jgi:hypothetical protein